MAQAWMPVGALTQKRLSLIAGLPGAEGGAGRDSGTGSAARFNVPSGVTVDSNGNVYVSDVNNHSIRKITAAGVVTILAGMTGASSGSTDGTGLAARFNFPWGLAVDGSGNVYVADSTNHTIRKITPAGVVTTLAGTAGIVGSTDDTGPAARFNFPRDVAVDGSGNVYVADASNHTIRKITAAGVVTTLAGTAGSAGSTDDVGPAARLNSPFGVDVDGSGNIYVADAGNHTLRKITPAGVVTTLAGTAGSAGSTDDTGPAARLNSPRDVSVDSGGNIYVTDSNNHTIRKVTAAGVVTTLAGTAGTWGSADGTGAAARFSFPRSGAVDSNGNVFVADGNNHTIRKITAPGVVTTFAGAVGRASATDATGSEARFDVPRAVAVDGSGNVYVADNSNHTIRKVTPAGVVTTLAGLAGSAGSADGTGAAARFRNPNGVIVDSSQNVYVTDTINHTIRKITPAGVVTTLAGTPGSSGSTDGTGSTALFNNPRGIALDSSGDLYVTDASNHTIRKVTAAGVVTTLAGLAGTSGAANGTGPVARFNIPWGITVDASGDLYVADSTNHTIRKVTAAGVVTTFAGSAGSFGPIDGTGPSARFNTPRSLAIDSAGDIYVADSANRMIRKVTASGVVTTLAGSQSIGSTDATGSAARFNDPHGVAVDSSGNVYVADTSNHSIRKITPTGDVTTLAGYQSTILGSADGTGLSARFNEPRGVTVDSSGNIYVADSANHTIRKITPAGFVTTFAGTPGISGNADGTGSAARFTTPEGLAVDNNGNIYVSVNHTIRKITPAGVVTTLAGTPGVQGESDGTGSAAGFRNPRAVATDSSGNIYVADTSNQTIRKITPAGAVTTLAGTAFASGSLDGTGPAARFNNPWGIAVDGSGNVYVGDSTNYTIRKITPAGVVTTLAGSAGNFGFVNGTGSAARLSGALGLAVDDNGNIYAADFSNYCIRKITPAGVVTNFVGTGSVHVNPVALPANIQSPRSVAFKSGRLYFSSQQSILWAPIP